MLQPRPVHYPESDGQPVAETEEHLEAMTDLFQTLRRALGDPQRWHVFGNQLFYYVEGDNQASFSPDVYVIRGVPQWPHHRIWKLWDEPEAVPALVIELSSPSSWRHDLGFKRDLYERLGVEEYVVYDVLRQSGGPALRVWRREGERLVEQADSTSRVVGVGFEPDGWRLRLVSSRGEAVRSDAEQADAEARRADAEARRADAEAERRSQTEQALAKALAELERLRGGS